VEGKLHLAIQYRTFRNYDPPALVEVWNQCFTSRGAFPLRNCALLEICVLAKPYFDPAGLIIAEDAGKVIGFAHAGFGPNAAETDICADVGIICVIGVIPSHRRKGIGTELLRRCEAYLKQYGVKEYVGGGIRPLNPFYFGMYGGANSPGFLASDLAAAPFFERHSYQVANTTTVFERHLLKAEPVVDQRFLGLRWRYDVQLLPQAEIPSWWQDCVLGQFEPVEFRLVNKLSGMPTARTMAWEIQGTKCNEQAAGILDLQVRPDAQRQGLARFLLSQMMRYIQEHDFKRVEIHCPESNQPLVNLVQGMGFAQVDVGRSYKRAAEPAL
jgi:ribosomal protein S18 acetylase RimI-like enzyme